MRLDLEESASVGTAEVITLVVIISVVVVLVVVVVVVVFDVLVKGNRVGFGSVHVDVAVGEALQHVTWTRREIIFKIKSVNYRNLI